MHAIWPASPPPPVGQQICPAPPQALQVPGMPVAPSRPAQPRPAIVHEPLFPVPQQGWPAAPQAPHWLPVVEIMHDVPVMQSVMPPSDPAVEQQA